ncbi:MAG: hypothetical protein ABSB18_01760 [Candidatus Omnitrophota bacterium]
MRDSSAPEEKLLKLIRGPKKQPQETLLNKEGKASKERNKPRFNFFLPADFNTDKAIWTIFIISCIYLSFSLVYPFFGSKRIEMLKGTKENPAENKISDKPEIKPYEFYAGDLKNRNIFGAQTTQGMGSPINAATSDMVKDIALVGIISGDNPQAVIEDKRSQKTYYLTAGQFIGEIQVEKIMDGKIILNYRGEKFELFL